MQRTGRSVASTITSVLLTFPEAPEPSLSEIARPAGLPICTAHQRVGELLVRQQ